MPKERRDRSVSFDRARTSPFPCSSTSSLSKQSLPKNPMEGQDTIKEWEEAKCPVCLEYPHNAILLLCSSHQKGCRPYMCDTSYRHSNCFDLFRKSFSQIQQTPSHTTVSEANVTYMVNESPAGASTIEPAYCENSEKLKLVCPLCRGEINGWVVVEPARLFMNTKLRNCASETCDFSGSYNDLRKHARAVHPLLRPSEADPERQREWRRLERQRDLVDLLSTLRSSIGDNTGENDIDNNDIVNDDYANSSNSTLFFDEGGLLTVFFLIRVFRRPGSSRRRAQVTVRRRRHSTRLWGESYDGDNSLAARDEDSNPSSEVGFVSGSDSGLGLGRHTISMRGEATGEEDSTHSDGGSSLDHPMFSRRIRRRLESEDDS